MNDELNQFNPENEDLLTSMQRYSSGDELPPPPAARPAWEAFAPPPEALMDSDDEANTPDENPWGIHRPPPPEALVGGGSLWDEELPVPQRPAEPFKEPFRLNKTGDELWQEEAGNDSLPPLLVYTEPEKPTKAAPKPRKNKMKTKKKKPIKRFFAWLLAIVLIVTASIGVLGFLAAGRMNIEPVDSTTRSAIRQAPRGSALVTNILLIGIDEPMPNGRADTLILLSIDHRTRSLKLTSILRDSWVRFPGGNFRKINEVTIGRNGGGPLAMQVVSENFGVRVDHYILMYFDAFETIIDSLGGISVPITPAEINALVRDTRLGRQIGRAEMERQMERNGVVRLSGEQALIYVRIRQRDTDMDRARRNRTMIEAVVRRAVTQPWRMIPMAVNALPELNTSLPQWRTAMLAMGAPVYVFYGVQEFQTPAPGTFRNSRQQGMFVFEVDFPANRRLLREFIYG